MCARRWLAWVVGIGCLSVVEPLAAQVVGFTEQRPFVIAVEPVIGPGGAVGGVAIDPRGLLAGIDPAEARRLVQLRREALTAPPKELAAGSPLRKVSLRGVMRQLRKSLEEGAPLPEEVQRLAGLVRLEYLFLLPEEDDLILAGPAEPWQVGPEGVTVGTLTGRPTLRLDDLLVAFRTAEGAATGDGLRCSIDPTEEGLARLRRLLASRALRVDPSLRPRLEAALGRQVISVWGVEPTTHFAQVMVAADFRMKQLGMGLEPSPVPGLTDYLTQLAAAGAEPRSAMPRWWLEPHYESLLRDEEGLAWKLSGQGVRAQAEEAGGGRAGEAQRWADRFTEQFPALAREIPVFAQLRNCIDLAVVAALCAREDLPGRAGCDLTLLADPRIQPQAFPAPREVASRAALVRSGDRWIVSVSGGVDLDSWGVVERAEVREELAALRPKAEEIRPRWWWD